MKYLHTYLSKSSTISRDFETIINAISKTITTYYETVVHNAITGILKIVPANQLYVLEVYCAQKSNTETVFTITIYPNFHKYRQLQAFQLFNYIEVFTKQVEEFMK